MNLKIEYLNVDEIRPYENNPRKHDVDQIKKIADSITEFNFTNPVLIDENNVLLAGHGRLLAAKKLKIEKVPCVRITYLTESQKKAYRIADNNLTLLGDWDIDLLGLELKELSEQDLDFDIEVTGFEVPEIEEFRAAVAVEETVYRILILDRQVHARKQVIVVVSSVNKRLPEQSQLAAHDAHSSPADPDTVFQEYQGGMTAHSPPLLRVKCGLRVHMHVNVVAGVVQKFYQLAQLREMVVCQYQVCVSFHFLR